MKRKNCVPKCPHCGEESHKTVNTYYTRDDEIIRVRRCENCNHRWYTYQEPEFPLDPSVYHVKIPRWGSTVGAKKRIYLEKVQGD